jgi:DNA (cytosine-5)-methyltransferase 1
MMNRHPTLTVAEYFAGIGLVRMGLETQGWEVVFANDFSSKKYEMYQGFFPDAMLHYRIADIFSVDPRIVPQTILATCSFPCIDLSLAGNRNGIEGKHSSAFWGFIQILAAQEDSAPPIVLVENVPGWLTSNKGADFRITVKALNDLGYACDVFTLDALRFTPQSRLRVFLVGVRSIDIAPSREVWSQRSKALLPTRLVESVAANSDLMWFAQDLPEPPPLRHHGLSEIVECLVEGDTRWWTEDEVQRHLKMMDRRHLERVMRLKNGRNLAYRTFYRRRRQGLQRAEVRDDDLSGCLRTAVGGSGKQFLVVAGRGQVRMRTMTAREYARLQGVPDTYAIYADGVQALTGFGDAVCVPAISWIAQHALNPLARQVFATLV